MELAWFVVGFEAMVKKIRTLTQLEGFTQDVACEDLISLKTNLLSYLKDLLSKKRTAAVLENLTVCNRINLLRFKLVEAFLDSTVGRMAANFLV